MNKAEAIVLQLLPVNALVYRVMDRAHGHIGNLKFANGAWKFKAIGYEPAGNLIPGGGIYTHKHNTIVDMPDAAELAQALTSLG